MNNQEITNWLLEGDVSIRYQTYRDLLGKEKPELQNQIEIQGWGAEYLRMRNNKGHWGNAFYSPKWTSSHYTLLELRNLEISPDSKPIRESLEMILNTEKGIDGGLNPGGVTYKSDVCINGMGLNYCCYFKMPQNLMEHIVDFILSQKMPDGGFNCQLNRIGAHHSSMHTTISVLEGILQYRLNGYKYRIDELLEVEKTSQEFLLQHQLFKSDKTGDIIKKQFLTLSNPTRWYYNILRVLDYFQEADFPYEERLQNALDVLEKKKTKEGIWKVQAKHPGKVFFEMEKPGQMSRWNTLKALRVLKHFR